MENSWKILEKIFYLAIMIADHHVFQPKSASAKLGSRIEIVKDGNSNCLTIAVDATNLLIFDIKLKFTSSTTKRRNCRLKLNKSKKINEIVPEILSRISSSNSLDNNRTSKSLHLKCWRNLRVISSCATFISESNVDKSSASERVLLFFNRL